MVRILVLVAALAGLACTAFAQSPEEQCEEIASLTARVNDGIEAVLQILPPDIEKMGADGDTIGAASIRAMVVLSGDAEKLAELMASIAEAVPQLWRIQDAVRDLNANC